MRIRDIQQALALILAAAVIQVPLHADDYCWKDSKTRGIGTIPSDCAFGTEKQGLLCYPTCAAGFTGVANVCWQNCPAGFTDDGAYCRKPAAYGRGAGYAWQVQDGLNNAGMLARCQSSEGRACEMWGALAYPTCKDGFAAFGANVCSPVCQGGMTDIGVSCAKKTATRDTIVSTCGAGMVYEAGLCYKACSPGYAGVGPVCWGTCPANLPYQCGAGCAKDIDTCATTTNDQVLSVVSSVTDIALMALTAGLGTAAKKGIEQGTKVGISAAAKSFTKNVSKQAVIDSLKATAKKEGKELADTTLETWAEAVGTYETQAEIDGVAGVDMPDFNWADLDPTGIASIVTAYAHPVCAPPPAGTVVPGYAPTSTIPVLPPGPPPPTWRAIAGSASDIAVTDTGIAWAIGSDTTPDKSIWRKRPDETTWTAMPGRAKRVGAGGSDTVVVVTDFNGAIFKWSGSAWNQLPGWASDAAVDGVGNVFVLGRNGSVWEMKLGQTVWTAIPGLNGLAIAGTPVRISAAGSEKVTIVTDQGRGAAWVAGASGWTDAAYGGTDIATLADGSNYATAGTQVQHAKFGYQGEPAGAGTKLQAVAAGGHNAIWVVAENGNIWKRQ